MELSGYDFVWVAESVGFDSLPILGTIATQTRKIGFGTGVVNVYSRSATQLAMAAATIEELSPGRFILGIGASSKGVVADWHRLEFRGQLGRVESYVDALATKLKKERTRLPVPFSSARRDIPLYLAGVGDKMVSLARSKADGVLFFMKPFPEVRTKTRELASEQFKVCVNVVACVSGDRNAAEVKARKTVAFYLTYGSYRRSIQLRDKSGVVGEAVAKVRDDWLRGRKEDAARRVPQELLRDVAVYGRPSDCKRAIEEYSHVRGLDMLGLQFNPGERDLAESMKLFASVSDKS